jgi:hypothetical protein
VIYQTSAFLSILWNAKRSDLPKREPGSNVTDLSPPQPEKHDLDITETDDGTTIDFSPLSEKTNSSNLSNLDPASKITDSSMEHPAKADEHKLETDDGISMDINPDIPNADSSICSR